jgi:hypothetical protein
MTLLSLLLPGRRSSMDNLGDHTAPCFSPISHHSNALQTLLQVGIREEYREHTPTDSSIHRLPPEVLLIVFECGLNLDRPYAFLRRLRVPFSVLVSHVCAHWRAVALQSTCLWTDIQLTLHHGIKLWKIYLQRSFPAPLSLDLICGPSRGLHDVAMLSSALHLLIPHIHRWRRLTVFTDRDQVIKALAEGLKDATAPILETLEFLHHDVSWWGDAMPIQFFCGDTPKLSTIRLRNVTWDWRRTWPIHLVTLDLEIPHSYTHMALSWGEFEDMVINSPNLKHLGLAGAPIALPATDLHFEPVAIDTLRSLRLKPIERDRYSSRLCSLLLTPRLEELTIEGGMRGVMRAMPSWRPWSDSNVKPSEWEVKYPRLRKLSLVNIDSWEPDLISLHFAQGLPSVEHLRLVGVDTAPIFRFLTQLFDDALPSVAKDIVPWQRLKTVEVEKWPRYEHVSPHMLVAPACEVTSAEVEGIRRLVEHRIKVGKPMRTLHVRPVDALQDKALAGWLAERGLCRS